MSNFCRLHACQCTKCAIPLKYISFIDEIKLIVCPRVIKSKGFKKSVDGQCQAPAKVVNIWILFSLKKRTLLTEKPVQIALTFSLFFSAAPKPLLDFSYQLHNALKNSNCLYTCRNLTLPIHGLFKSLGHWLSIL